MTVRESDWVWITLAPEQIEFSDKWAHARQNNAVAADLAPHNNAPVEPDAATALHVLGLRGECAGYIYLKPVKWHLFKPGRLAMEEQLPDLEDWIDMKARTKSWHSLIVQRDDPPDWAYVLVCAHEHPRYCLIGWCYGHEAQQQQHWDDPAGGRPAYFIKQDNPILRPVADLLREVRKRQARTDAERAGHPNGFVGYDSEGHFVHYCKCGRDAGNGYGVSLRAGNLGVWFCSEHNPKGVSDGIRQES